MQSRDDTKTSTSALDSQSVFENKVGDVNSNELEVTFIGDDEAVPDYNGVDIMEEDDTESNFVSTSTLRKNLVETFDKHATKIREKIDSRSYSSNVKEKIRAFEKNNCKSHVRFGDTVTTSTLSNVPPIMKPPTFPVPKNESTSENSLLSVYLRVRPHSSCEEFPLDSPDSLNTVEILKSENNADDQSSVSIRTYPPINSNTAKAIRGQYNQYSGAYNSNITSGDNTRSSEEAAAKGVKEYSFKQVFGAESSQEEIYNSIAVPLINGLFPKNRPLTMEDKVVGQSALLFSYGITNAGKTYTMMGEDKAKDMIHGACLSKTHGIIPRALNHIFSKIDNNGGVKHGLYMSYFEIYNEQIFDLLPKEKKGSQSNHILDREKSLRIREGRGGRSYVEGLAKHHVSNFSHGMKLAHAAKSKRHTSCNKINKDSSRSHVICQIELFAYQHTQHEKDDESVCSTASGYSSSEDSVKSNSFHKRSVRMWIVDLAGSERSKRTGTFTKIARQKEANYINSSLMKLMRCLQTIRFNQTIKNSLPSSVVPFRESKLTHLFMDHLTGHAASRTSMIVNINPLASDFDETQHVLSYAIDAKSIRISSAELNKKRNEIQTNDHSTFTTQGEKECLKRKYGNEKGRFKPPSKKIAQLAKKLSPRTMLAKKRDELALTKKRKAELLNLRGGSTKISDNVEEHSKNGRFDCAKNKKRRLEEEVKGLEETLKESQKEVARLKVNCAQLNTKLRTCESEIRAELSEETKIQINEMRERHNETINRLQNQIFADPTPSKSAKKVRKDKREEMIEELIDKVDECEDEIKRLEKMHKDDITRIKKEYIEKLEEKEREIVRISTFYEDKIKEQTKEINLIKVELISSQKISDGVKIERDEIHQRYSNLVEEGMIKDDQVSTDDSDLLSSDMEEASPKKDKENDDPTGCSTELRRLPRRKCSEVACANMSPVNVNEAPSPPSSKKKRRFCSALSKQKQKQKQKHNRSPFKDVQSIHYNTQIISKGEETEALLDNKKDVKIRF